MAELPFVVERRVQDNFDALRKRLEVIEAPLVTSLPANPTDGQEIYFVADAANGVVWRLRYRAASSSAYKWEYVGGAPLWSTVETQEVGANAGPYDLATVGPTVTLPLAGDYDVEMSAEMYINGGAGTQSGYLYLANAAGTTLRTLQVNQPSPFLISPQAWRGRTPNLGAQAHRIRYGSTAGFSHQFSHRVLSMCPVRVG